MSRDLADSGTARLDELEVGWRTDVGRVRDHNEDALFVPPPALLEVRPRGLLLVVADGMGGHAGGEHASRLAVHQMVRLYGLPPEAIERAPGEVLGGLVQEAHRAIRQAAADTPALEGMGTTLTAALVRGTTVHLAHVGDSRAYRIRSGTIQRLTRDHSLIAEQVRHGYISEEEAEHHPGRHVILRAVGGRGCEADVSAEELAPGDRLLLCTDGLHGVVADPLVLAIVEGAATAEEACTCLVDAANEAGGPDNVTAILLDTRPPP